MMKKNKGINISGGSINAENIAIGKKSKIEVIKSENDSSLREKLFNVKKDEKTIYFSYAWSDNEKNREEFIDKLYKTLKSKHYVLKRDKMDLGYRG